MCDPQGTTDRPLPYPSRLPRTGALRFRPGRPTSGGDANRPGNTRNGFWGPHPLSFFWGRVFGSPFLALLYLCVLAAASTSFSAGHSADSPRGRWGYPDNLRRLYFACWNGFRL